MSLDHLTAPADAPPTLCLPHQCEFLSDAWLAEANTYLQRHAPRLAAGLPPFCMAERFVDAPPHLGLPDNIAQWCVRWDGQMLHVGRDLPHDPQVLVTGSYSAGLFMAQIVGALTPDTIGRGLRECRTLYGEEALLSEGALLPDGAHRVLAGCHDHMARKTVENPDLAHRARALGLVRHLREIEEQGYTVIEHAISDAFADEVREVARRAVMAHDGHQLQWMLYHGLEMERLVQNAPLLTLMDASLGRGAVIASISAIVRGPGPGTIPIHTDYSMVPEPYPDFAMTGVGVWALEDWSVASGPTWIVPGSHRERRAPHKGEGIDRGVPVEMPKGSVVYFTHGVWHWQGERTEAGERVTIHSHFNRGILRGLEPKKIDAQMLHRNPPRLGEMLGEDDWFDKLDARGRDYSRAAHMARLQSFNQARLQTLMHNPDRAPA